VLAHLLGEAAKGVGEAGLERGTDGRMIKAGRWEKGLAKGDPDGDAAGPKARDDVAAVAAHDGAGNDGSACHLRKTRNTGALRGAFENGAGSIADAALGEDAHGMPGAQPGEGDADSVPIEMEAVHGEGVDPAQPRAKEGEVKEFDHAHPVDFAAGGDAEKGWVEVADVIGGKNPRPIAAGGIWPQDADFDKWRKEDFGHQPREMVKQDSHGRQRSGNRLRGEE
jgi:hypothetical protein